MPRPVRQRRLLNVNEVREILPLSKARLHQIINSGELAATRVGKRVFVDAETLDKFIAERTSRSA